MNRLLDGVLMKNLPHDEFNRALLKNVFPEGWKNPKPAPVYDLIVIGGGPGGMTAATVALGMKARVAIVEKSHFGGECLNVGCIPSKALLRSSRLAAEIRDAAEWGIKVPKGWSVDFEAVMRRVRRLRSEISVSDKVMHFKQLGADIFLGAGRVFPGPIPSMSDGSGAEPLKKAITSQPAGHSSPVSLDVPGLQEVGYLTNQTVFNLTHLPRRLAVIGGGPISCELAQAFARFGSEVTLITRGSHLLPKDDTAASDKLLSILKKEGMQVVFNSQLQRCEKKGKEKVLYLDSQKKSIAVDEILIAIGRMPAVQDLGIEQAKVHFDAHKGIITDDFLQTSNPDIYAIDVSARYNFTHISIDLAKR